MKRKKRSVKRLEATRLKEGGENKGGMKDKGEGDKKTKSSQDPGSSLG